MPRTFPIVSRGQKSRYPDCAATHSFGRRTGQSRSTRTEAPPAIIAFGRSQSLFLVRPSFPLFPEQKKLGNKEVFPGVNYERGAVKKRK